MWEDFERFGLSGRSLGYAFGNGLDFGPHLGDTAKGAAHRAPVMFGTKIQTRRAVSDQRERKRL